MVQASTAANLAPSEHMAISCMLLGTSSDLCLAFYSPTYLPSAPRLPRITTATLPTPPVTEQSTLPPTVADAPAEQISVLPTSSLPTPIPEQPHSPVLSTEKTIKFVNSDIYPSKPPTMHYSENLEALFRDWYTGPGDMMIGAIPIPICLWADVYKSSLGGMDLHV